MKPATAPHIVLARYKDAQVLSTELIGPVTKAATSLLGAHFVNTYDGVIADACKGAYVLLAMAHRRTLGEELAQIYPVLGTSLPRSIGLVRVLLLALLTGLERTAVVRFAIRYFPSLSPDEVMANVQKVVRALLFVSDRFASLPHFLLGIWYLGLKPLQQVKSGSGHSGAYVSFGLMIAIELAVRLYRYLEYLRMERISEAVRLRAHDSSRSRGRWDGIALAVGRSSDTGGGGGSDEDDDDPDNSVTGKCSLCLNARKVPTVTSCGHIFCWQCVAEWASSSSTSGLCPLCRQPITLSSLVPLYGFVAQPPRRLGRAGDTEAVAAS